MNKTALLTVVFPLVGKFFPDFLSSLDQQDFKAFDVIVVNDGLPDLDKILVQFPRINFYVLKGESTPSKNREKGISFIQQQKYKNLILGDADDYFSNNRIGESLISLEKEKICFNEISAVNETGVLVNENYFSNRLKNEEKINIYDLLDKNMLGFSNTALRLEIIKSKVAFPEKLIAVDWYFFTSLLLQNGQAIFNNKAITYYRQHGSNLAGIGSVSEKDILNAVNVKTEHYNYFSDYKIFGNRGSRFNEISKKTKEKEYFRNYYQFCSKEKPDFPFWWEPAKLPNEQ